MSDGPNNEEFFNQIAKEQLSHAEPLDREAIRNEVLEEAAKLCEKAVAPRDMVRAIGSSAHYAHCANEIRALKSQPAQPSDNEMLDWMIDNNGQIYPKDGLFMVLYGPDHHKEYGPLSDSRKNAIKAAMQAERGGK